jgi:hypothetical protein
LVILGVPRTKEEEEEEEEIEPLVVVLEGEGSLKDLTGERHESVSWAKMRASSSWLGGAINK